MKNMSKKRGFALKSGSNVRVIESGSDGAFHAYRVPEKTLPARLLEAIGSGYALVVDPEDRWTHSDLRVGNTVRNTKKLFEFKRRGKR
jgi:hypothetical protein